MKPRLSPALWLASPLKEPLPSFVGSLPARTLLVFPPDTTVTGTGKSLLLTVDGVHLRVGDEFFAGTRGSGTGQSLSTYGTLAQQAPQDCQGIPAVQVDQLSVAAHG